MAELPHKTRFHELAHVVLGHTTEADAGMSDSELTPRSLREVEAEAVALVCLEALGLPGAEYCRGYIQHWNARRDGEPIPERSAQRILKADRSDPASGTRARDGRSGPMRAALYVRVSTLDQHPQNQIDELRRYVAARGWVAREFVDHGISGAKENRPALDSLLREARRRTIDVVVVWSLDRLGRSLKHLISLLDEFQALHVALISLREGLDLTTPAGRLQWQIIGAISEFERARIAERIRAGLARARAQGRRLGRPAASVPWERLATVEGLTDRAAARRLKVARSTIQRWRAMARKSPPRSA